MPPVIYRILKGAKNQMNQRNKPTHPGARTPAELDQAFLVNLAKVVTGALTAVVLTALMILFS